VHIYAIMMMKYFNIFFKTTQMIRAFTYNVFEYEIFPYKNGLQQVYGVPLIVVQGIFTRDGKKAPEFVDRENEGYKIIRSGLAAVDSVIGFFGKESSGANAALDIFLEDWEKIGFNFKPKFCRHVDVLTQSKLIERKIPYEIFIDYAEQCEEHKHLEDAIMGEARRYSRSKKQY
jgi:hypothetical protein